MNHREPIVQPLLLALILTAGFAAVWAVAVFWSSQSAIEIIEPRQPGHNVVVNSLGAPLVQVSGNDYMGSWTYETLDGKQVPPEKVETIQGSHLSLPRPEPIWSYDWGQRIRVIPVGRPSSAYWYLVDDGEPAGAVYFVGYDAESAQCLGYLAEGGNCLQRPPAGERFPIDEKALAEGRVLAAHTGQWPAAYYYNFYNMRGTDFGAVQVYLLSGGRLVEADLSARRIRSLGEFPNALDVGMVEKWPHKPRHPPEWLTAVRTPEEVVLVDPHGGQVQHYTLPAALRKRGFTFYQSGEHEALLVAGPPVHVLGIDGEDVLRVTADGRILSQNELRWKGHWWQDGRNRAVVGPTVATAFPGIIPAIVLLPLTLTPERNWGWAAYVHGLPPAWPYLAAVLVTSAIAAWLCWRRQRRLDLPRTAAWVTFVFLLGPPGLVGYLIHRRRPPLTACEHCHERVPRDRPACVRCGTEFAPPAPTGNEIFAA